MILFFYKFSHLFQICNCIVFLYHGKPQGDVRNKHRGQGGKEHLANLHTAPHSTGHTKLRAQPWAPQRRRGAKRLPKCRHATKASWPRTWRRRHLAPPARKSSSSTSCSMKYLRPPADVGHPQGTHPHKPPLPDRKRRLYHTQPLRSLKTNQG